jgi:hypothetical protein
MAFDATHPADLLPGFRPGERMLHGKPYVFNQDLLNAHLADQRVARGLPADLSGLSESELTEAFYAYIDASYRRRHDHDVVQFGRAVCGERARREQKAAA